MGFAKISWLIEKTRNHPPSRKNLRNCIYSMCILHNRFNDWQLGKKKAKGATKCAVLTWDHGCDVLAYKASNFRRELDRLPTERVWVFML